MVPTLAARRIRSLREKSEYETTDEV